MFYVFRIYGFYLDLKREYVKLLVEVIKVHFIVSTILVPLYNKHYLKCGKKFFCLLIVHKVKMTYSIYPVTFTRKIFFSSDTHLDLFPISLQVIIGV